MIASTPTGTTTKGNRAQIGPASATLQTIEVAKEMAAQASLHEDSAVAIVAEGVLQAAQAIGPKAVAQVTESLPKEILASDVKELEGDG